MDLEPREGEPAQTNGDYQGPLEGLRSIKNQAFRYLCRGSFCNEIQWLELNASQAA